MTGAAAPGAPCPPVTVYVARSGRYTYGVRIEEGAVLSITAGGVVGRLVVSGRGRDGWRRFRGHTGDAWAVARAHGRVEAAYRGAGGVRALYGRVRLYQPEPGYPPVLRTGAVAISPRTSRVTRGRLRAIAESPTAVDV